MLKQRLITAAILIPLVIWSVFYLQTYTLSLVFAAILAAGAWEWAALAGLSTTGSRVFYVVAVLLFLILSSWTIMTPVLLYIVMGIALIWWVCALIWIQRYSRQISRQEGVTALDVGLNAPRINWNYIVTGILVFVPPWVALVVIHDEGFKGPYWVLFILVLIWGADSGAYFAGRRWGRKRLAPLVSPGKTWEGVLGASVVTVLLAMIGGMLLDVPGFERINSIMLCLLTTLFSIVGDLLESMLKRQAGVKDSGHVLPGHGGVLDRIDSLLAGLPIFAFGLLLQGQVS